MLQLYELQWLHGTIQIPKPTQATEPTGLQAL